MDVARGSELEIQADEEEEDGEGRESASSTNQFFGSKQEWQTGEAARRLSVVPKSLSACIWRLEFFKFCGGRCNGGQGRATMAGSKAGRCSGGHGCQGAEVEGGGVSWEKAYDILWWIGGN